MDDHLQRALVEIYAAVAVSGDRRASSMKKLDATGARLIATMAHLEEVILIRQHASGKRHAA